MHNILKGISYQNARGIVRGVILRGGIVQGGIVLHPSRYIYSGHAVKLLVMEG